MTNDKKDIDSLPYLALRVPSPVSLQGEPFRVNPSLTPPFIYQHCQIYTNRPVDNNSGVFRLIECLSLVHNITMSEVTVGKLRGLQQISSPDGIDIPQNDPSKARLRQSDRDVAAKCATTENESRCFGDLCRHATPVPELQLGSTQGVHTNRADLRCPHEITQGLRILFQLGPRIGRLNLWGQLNGQDEPLNRICRSPRKT